MPIYFRHDHYHHPDEETAERLRRIDHRLGNIERSTEIIMTDTSKLTAIAARLQAGETNILAVLQTVKDQNTSLAAQLAAIQTGDPATQAAIDAVVQSLTTTADQVDAAVAANPAIPNLT